MKVVTLPATVDQSHQVGAVLASYEVDEFVNTESVYCPLSYTVEFDNSRSWLSQNAVGSRQMDWAPMQNSEYGDYEIKVHATDPIGGDTYFVSYTLTIIRDCTMQVLTPPGVEDQQWVIGQPASDYTIDEFDNTMKDDFCPIVYTVAYDSVLPWVTWASDGNPLRIDWYTVDEVDYGHYTITFTATGIDGVTGDISYLLKANRPCVDA